MDSNEESVRISDELFNRLDEIEEMSEGVSSEDADEDED